MTVDLTLSLLNGISQGNATNRYPGKLPLASRPFLLANNVPVQKTVSVSIKPLKGAAQFELNLNRFDTIAAVKRICSEKMDLQGQQPRLLLKGKPMLDTKCLLDYGIKESGDVIHLSLKAETVDDVVKELIAEESKVVKSATETEPKMDELIFNQRLKSLLESRFELADADNLYQQILAMIKSMSK
jgi:hypothetical protein